MRVTADVTAREVRVGDVVESDRQMGEVTAIQDSKLGLTPITWITVDGYKLGYYPEEAVTVVLEDDGEPSDIEIYGAGSQ